MHRSRLHLIVIDVNDLAVGIEFWKAALNAEVDPSSDNTPGVYERLELPGESSIRLLLQLVADDKAAKNRAHIDIATDNVMAEVERLKNLGATKLRPFDGGPDGEFWVLQDPFGNEFCVVTPEHRNVLDDATEWDA